MLFGGYAFKLSLEPIAGVQWVFAFAFGIGQIIVDFLLKFIPDSFCPSFGNKPKTDDHSPHVIPMIRRSRTQSQTSLKNLYAYPKDTMAKKATINFENAVKS